MYGDYCEIPEFYHEQRVRARKPHRCCETKREIQKGEFYWRCSGKWGGEIYTYCQVESAYHFARHLNLDIFQDCLLPFGEVNEFRDYISDYMESEREEQEAWEIWKEIIAGKRVWTKEDKLRLTGAKDGTG